MQLKVIGTGSKGNAYLLENEEEALLIECGVNIKEIKAALNFKFSKLVGCLVTHEHGDHAKSIKEIMASGVDVYATEGTHRACGTIQNHRARVLNGLRPSNPYPNCIIGNFLLKPFDVNHDAAEPVGYLINHKETGNVLFLTDTYYSGYTFRNLNNIIVEANYCPKIARRKLGDMEFLRNRILKSHMSIDTCIDFLKANDLTQVNNIVLIHLSDSNSNESEFQKRVRISTGIHNVTVADNGIVLKINKTPF